MPYGYGSRGNKSSNRERGADRNRSQTTSKSKGISASKTTTRANPHTSSGSSKTTVATGNQIRASKEKFTTAVGRNDLNTYKVKQAKFLNPVVNIVLNSATGTKLRQKMFEKNRKYFQSKVAGKMGYKNTLDSYKSYMNARLQGDVDAYGRKINKKDGDNRTTIERRVLKEVEQENKLLDQKAKTEVKQTLFKKSGNRSGMIGRSVNNRRISAYRRFLLNEDN